MDSRAFYKLSYGLYIVSTTHKGKDCGCVVNTLEQVTSTPAKLAVAINKENYTCKTLLKSGVFAGVALTESADMKLIGEFGFKSSETVDKFTNFQKAVDLNSVPYLTQNVAARFSAKVISTQDLGSHIMFIGEVVDCEVISDEDVMTYAYYHKVKKGTTPPKASSYNKTPDTVVTPRPEAPTPEIPTPEATKIEVPTSEAQTLEETSPIYRCTVCNYRLSSDNIPDNFECPICGQGKDMLEKIQ
ncbi:MAG: flavin reductase [Clostridia bacterium]|nr:flavin reductase [Clostridia bacterium]